jgi:subtilisin family serine protease
MAVAAALLASTGVVLAQTAGEEGHTTSEERAKPAPLSQPQNTTGDVIPGRYIVVLKDGTGEAKAQGNGRDPEQVASELAQENKVEGITYTYESALKGFAAKIPQERVGDVRSDPRVAFVAKDREVHATSQVLPTGVDRVEADRSSARAGDGSGAVNADIAVIDSGIYKHSDLNVVGGYNCTTTDRKAWSDGNGHGTHVAGSAAARDNSSGVVGVAPGARLWAIRVLKSNGHGSTSSIVCGINRVTQMNKDSATTNNIEIANMSLGGSGRDDGNCGNTNNDPMHGAICNSVAAKITYVVAAGNDGVNAARSVPAAYDEVITVSALADYDGKPWGQGDAFDCFQDWAFDDEFYSFSNFGRDVDIAAPGVCIKSTWKGSGSNPSSAYRTITGTSMASPHVAGAAALYKASHPMATPSRVRTAMLTAANTEAPNQGHTDPSGRHPESVMLAKNLGKR